MPASSQIAALVEFLVNARPWNSDPAVAELQQKSPAESQLATVVERIEQLRALIVDVGSSMTQLQEVKGQVLEKERKAKTALHALERELFMLEKDKSCAEDAIQKEWQKQRDLEASLWELCARKDDLEAQIAAHNAERAATVVDILQRVTEQQQTQIHTERQQLSQIAAAQQQREKEVQNLKELLEEQMSEMERLNNQAHTQQAESLQRELVLRHEIHELEDALHNRTFGGDPDSVELDTSTRQPQVAAKTSMHDVSTDTVENLDVSALTAEAENTQLLQIEQQRQELEQLRRQITNLQSRVQLNDRIVSNLEETNNALRAEAEALRLQHQTEGTDRRASPAIPSAPIDEVLPPSPTEPTHQVHAPELQSLMREMGELRANVSQLMERDKSTAKKAESVQPTQPAPVTLAPVAGQTTIHQVGTKPAPSTDETKPYLRSTEMQLELLLGLKVLDGSNFGVRVVSVQAGSIAERAGIAENDLIAFCNDLHLRQSHDLWTIVRLSRISDILPLKILRGTLPTRHTVFCQLPVDPNSRPGDHISPPTPAQTAPGPAQVGQPLPTITHFGSPQPERRQLAQSRNSPLPATTRRSLSPSVTRL